MMIEDAYEDIVVLSQLNELAVVEILILHPPLQEHMDQILSRGGSPTEEHDAKALELLEKSPRL